MHARDNARGGKNHVRLAAATIVTFVAMVLCAEGTAQKSEPVPPSLVAPTVKAVQAPTPGINSTPRTENKKPLSDLVVEAFESDPQKWTTIALTSLLGILAAWISGIGKWLATLLASGLRRAWNRVTRRRSEPERPRNVNTPDSDTYGRSEVRDLAEALRNLTARTMTPAALDQSREDSRAQALLERTRTCFRVYDLENGLTAADELRGLACSRATDLSPQIAADVYAVLVNAEMVKAITTKHPREAGAAAARIWLSHARGLPGETDRERFDALEAAILAYEGEPSRALQRLVGSEHPEAQLQRLRILYNEQRFVEGSELVGKWRLHHRWCDHAILVLIRAGRTEDARKIVDWSLDKLEVSRRCHLVFGLELLRCLQEQEGTPQESSTSSDRLRIAAEVLEVIVRPILACGEIIDPLDDMAVDTLAQICVRRGDLERVVEFARLRPIPLSVADIVSRGTRLDVPDLTTRLRTERPEAFDARLLYAVLRSRHDGDHEAALNEAIELVQTADTDQRKRALAEILAELAHHAASEQQPAIDKLIRMLLGKDHLLVKLRDIEGLLSNGALEDAEQALEEVRDEHDPLWLQVHGSYLLRRGEARAALDAFKAAAGILPHPDLLEQTAFLAIKLGVTDEAVRLFRKLVELDPNRRSTRHNLGMALLRVGRCMEAAQEFSVLAEQEPDLYRKHQAQALAHGEHIADALTALSKAPAHDRDLELIVLRAQLYSLLSDRHAAFETMERHRTTFWEDEGFLRPYMDIAYSAEKDREASEAMHQLATLGNSGRLRTHAVRTMTVDEIAEIQRQAIEAQRTLNSKTTVGEMPWTFVERTLNRVPYWAWRLRTEFLPWLPSTQEQRAARTIYATDGPEPYAEPEVLASSHRIVVDESALITLHRLGLLDRAVAFFGMVHVPAAVLLGHLDESRSLAPSQPSRRTAAVAVRHAFESGIVQVDGGDVVVPSVDEYPEVENSAHHCLRTLASRMHAAGRLADTEHSRLMEIANRKPPENPDGELVPGAAVRFTYLTLSSLSQIGILDKVFRAFRVVISESDLRRATQDAVSYNLRDQVRDWHTHLWDLVVQDPRILALDYVLPADVPTPTTGTDVRSDPAFAALVIAQREGHVLLADDRCLHRIARSEATGKPITARATDELLNAMLREGSIQEEEHANAFRQLMEWRYRFIVPPCSILVTIAKRYLVAPPGEELRSIARYAHECMSDPGVPRYSARADVMRSSADRLVLLWSRLAGEFVGALSADSAFKEDACMQLVDWAATELLPHAPRTLGLRAAELDRTIPQYTLCTALTEAALSQDADRAGRIVRRYAEVLGFSEREYARLIAETVNGI
jgi:tetratricopeptide (TPR) repeat protein